VEEIVEVVWQTKEISDQGLSLEFALVAQEIWLAAQLAFLEKEKDRNKM
jgi:hypothetical protein